MNLIEMWGTMGPVAKAIGVILVIMSMISFGVAIERIYTFTQARKQSKLYAPQVAKHLKEGRLKDAIAISSSKNYRYSHLAKVVLAGLQEYQFQQEAGGGLSREDLVDTVRRAIQRASALTRPVSRKRSSKRRSAWSWPSPRCGSTTTSPAGLSTSTSRWTTRRPSSSTTSSRRPRNFCPKWLPPEGFQPYAERTAGWPPWGRQHKTVRLTTEQRPWQWM